MYSDGNSIMRNMITNNGDGIYFWYSCHNNIIFEKDITTNEYGIRIERTSSSNNMICHNNFIGNTQNAYGGGGNTWYNGILQQGNYWDTYDDPGEGAFDNDSDGIADDPYPVPGGMSYDWYPLIHQFVLGDLNVDNVVDDADIDPFVLALVNPMGYRNQYRMLPVLHDDCNQDGVLNAFDIDAFVQLLTGG